MRSSLVVTVAAVMLAMPAAAQNQPASNTNADDAAQTQVTVQSPQQFVELATASNMFEIESSRVALEKSQQEGVKTFAQHMIEDHTAAGEEMKAAAQKDGITSMPSALDQKHKAKLDQLNGASGEQFDQLYVQMQTEAHQEAVSLFRSYSESGEGELKNFAGKTLPKLEEHYAMVQELAQ